MHFADADIWSVQYVRLNQNHDSTYFFNILSWILTVMLTFRHQKVGNVKKAEDGLQTQARLCKDHPTLHVLLSSGPKLSSGCF